MHDDELNARKRVAVADAADDRFALNPGILIGIGTGQGMVAGGLLGDLVAGMMCGAGAGVIMGSELEMYRRRTDQPNTTPPAARPRNIPRAGGQAAVAHRGVLQDHQGPVRAGTLRAAQ